MQTNITPFQRENLTKALGLFIEAVRDYIVVILTRQFGKDNWARRYKETIDPDKLAHFERDRVGGYDPRDLIDYPNLAQFCFKYRDLLRPDFGKKANAWNIHFWKIYEARNQINHYQSSISKDLLAEFWIRTREFAKGMKNEELYTILFELENAVPPAETNNGEASNADRAESQSTARHIPVIPVPNARYFLPILIRGKKAHVVHLCKEGETSNAFIRTVIYEQNSEKVHLFSLIEGAFQGRTTADRHGKCFIDSLTIENTDLVVYLEIGENNLEVLSSEIPENLSVDRDARVNGEMVLTSVNSSFERVIFKLQIQGIAYVGVVKTRFAPPDQIVDIALDFGSEASQVVVHHREVREKLNRVELLKNMKEKFFPSLEGELHQQDSDPELFRSQVFVLKEGVVMDHAGLPNQHNGDDLIRTLTRKDDIQKLKKTHALIPNSKLAHLGVYNFMIRYKDRNSNPYGVEESKFGSVVQDIQQTVIAHFLHTLLHSIHAQKNENKLRYIHIRFLVPNILEQARLTRLINQTYEFFDSPSVKERYHIGGVEVSTLSESDASFLGYWERAGIPQKNANYLIVDVGKGTTDYSLIKSNRDFDLSSEYRDGFIGAGNVLTYAFIDTIFTAFLGGWETTWEERRKLLKIIASAQTDMVEKYRFLEIVERIKRDYKGEVPAYAPLGELISEQLKEDIKKRLSEEIALSSLLKDITNALENIIISQPGIRDEFGFINNAVQKIVQKLKAQLLVSDLETVGDDFEKLHKIVLTGRGFLFKKLVDEMRKELGSNRREEDRVVIQETPSEGPNQLKKICLNGAFSGRIINYDSNVVGIPSLHSIMKTRVGPSLVTKRTIQKGAGDRTPHVRTDTLAEKLHTWLKNDTYYDEPEPEKEPEKEDTTVQGTLPPLLQFLTQGARFDELFNKNIHTVHVSGVKYKCDALRPNEAIDLLFDGEEFWLRTDNGLVALNYPLGFLEDDPMVWQTLFPFFDAVTDTHTPIDSSMADSDHEI